MCKKSLTHQWHRNFEEPPSADICHRCGIKRGYAERYKSICEPASEGRIRQDMDEIKSSLSAAGRNPEAQLIRHTLGWTKELVAHG